MQENPGCLYCRKARLAQSFLSSVVEDDIRGSVVSPIVCDALDCANCDCFGADGFPVAGQDVPLNWCETEFASDMEDGGTAGSVRCAKVADRSAKSIFEYRVAAGEFLTNA